jgi:hypothetical protein
MNDPEGGIGERDSATRAYLCDRFRINGSIGGVSGRDILGYKNIPFPYRRRGGHAPRGPALKILTAA